MTLTSDIHSRPNETSIAIVVPVDSLESIGATLAPSTVELQEAA